MDDITVLSDITDPERGCNSGLELQTITGLSADRKSDLQQQKCQKAHMTREISVTRCTTFQRVRKMPGVSKHCPVSLTRGFNAGFGMETPGNRPHITEKC